MQIGDLMPADKFSPNGYLFAEATGEVVSEATVSAVPWASV